MKKIEERPELPSADAQTRSPDIQHSDGKERPILFSGPMVLALLDGRKTQTRRVVNDDFDAYDGCHNANMGGPGGGPWWDFWSAEFLGSQRIRCPYGQPGDRLWVRERWATWMHARCLPGTMGGALSRDPTDWLYAATDPEWEAMDHDRRVLLAENAKREDGRAGNYVIRNSIHMPRWASRITLEITEVRVERLNQIGPKDAIAEGLRAAPGGWWSGFEGSFSRSPVGAYAMLWEHINGKGAWDLNPWVWVVCFRRIEGARLGVPAQVAEDAPGTNPK